MITFPNPYEESDKEYPSNIEHQLYLKYCNYFKIKELSIKQKYTYCISNRSFKRSILFLLATNMIKSKKQMMVVS